MDLFLKQICKKHNIDENEMLSSWNEFESNYKKYKQMKKPELVKICDDNNYSNKGSKDDLIKNIINKIQKSDEKVNKDRLLSSKKIKENELIDKLKKDIPTVVIKRNSYGNYEHDDTSLLFDKVSKMVIGKQCNDTGRILNLTTDDIETCKQYNFDYNYPSNLNNKVLSDDALLTEELLTEESLVSTHSDSSDEEIEY